MKKFYLLLFVIFYSIGIARATHIVGGEFELKYKGTAYEYTLILNLYFDHIHGNPGAEDASITCGIYSKRTNRLVNTFRLPRVSSSYVQYTNPVCTVAELETRLLKYSLDIKLNPQLYSDSEGYYVAWERCCRNNVISNIQAPQSAGNTFYLEFPAIVQQGTAFANSSPAFAVPRGDYACMNEPFTFDFSAKDPDGDQLVYSLVTPFAGWSSVSNPNPGDNSTHYPAPYPPIRWINGLDIDNVIPGPAPLRVDHQTGQLTFTANKAGLYVFSVLCQEYRAGKKIGEVRRDFQLMVINCPKNETPEVRLREEGKKDYYVEGQVITMADPAKRCMNFLISDKNTRENVKLTLRPLNFAAGLATLTPTSGTLTGPRDTLRSQLCWSECAESKNGEPLAFQVIVSDNSCPSPRYDTLLVRVNLPVSFNNGPAVRTSLTGNAATVLNNRPLTFAVTGTDPDQDVVTLQAAGRGFDMAALGMTFAGGSAKGVVTAPFTWQPACDKVREGQTYIVDFTVADKRCPGNEKTSIVSVALTYQLTPNQKPEIITTLEGNQAEIVAGQEIRFDVLASDKDAEPIVLSAAGRGFDMTAVGMLFAGGQSSTGQIRSPFYWKPDCKVLQELSGVFVIDFVVDDKNCKLNTNVITVQLKVSDYEVVTANFEPPNVFTPNNDGINDTFYVPNLPLDNCQDQFERIEIYNQWGKVVFEGRNREFKWNGFGFPTGVYYYLIKYRNSTYKGTVSLLR